MVRDVIVCCMFIKAKRAVCRVQYHNFRIYMSPQGQHMKVVATFRRCWSLTLILLLLVNLLFIAVRLPVLPPDEYWCDCDEAVWCLLVCGRVSHCPLTWTWLANFRKSEEKSCRPNLNKPRLEKLGDCLVSLMNGSATNGMQSQLSHYGDVLQRTDSEELKEF